MKTIFKKQNSLTDTVFHYCPGCSHGIVHRLVCEVIDELDISGKTIAVEPVGCAVTVHNYFDFLNIVFILLYLLHYALNLFRNLIRCRYNTARTSAEINRCTAFTRKLNIFNHLSGTHFNGQKRFRFNRFKNLFWERPKCYRTYNAHFYSLFTK